MIDDDELHGWDELDQMMDRFGPEFTKQAVARGVFAASKLLEMEMKARCPIATQYEQRRPGAMRDAIDVIPKKFDQDRPHIVSATISPTYEKAEGEESPGYYCRFVEYGSVHNPQPQPFMRNTIDEAGEAAINYCISVVSSEFEKMTLGKGEIVASEPAG